MIRNRKKRSEEFRHPRNLTLLNHEHDQTTMTFVTYSLQKGPDGKRDWHPRTADVNDADAWDDLGCYLSSNERHEEAIVAFRRAVTLNPDLLLAWRFLGLSLAAVDRWEEAIEAMHHYDPEW